MKYECEMIQDLLPLYKDGACSQASTRIVEEHLSECPGCTRLLQEMKDTKIDEIIIREKETVIDSQTRFFKRKSAAVGGIIGAVFSIPILVCLIVNLASGHALDWFFIVLASMLVAASLFVVPLIAPENRMFLTMTTFTSSVIILLAVICIYTGGNWFFIAASSVLFGLTLCFSPFIACRRPMNTYLGSKKGLAVMAVDTVTFFLMMLCIGLHVREEAFFPMAFSISAPLIAAVWIMFLIIRYLPAGGITKTGACIAFLSLFCYYAGRAIVYLNLRTMGDRAVVVYTEPTIGFMITGVTIGAIVAAIGIVVGKKEKTNA